MSLGDTIKVLIVLVVAAVLVVAMVFLPDQAKAAVAKQGCPLGKFCMFQSASSVGASSGDHITFDITLRNNLNFASRNLVLRYNVARQVMVRSSKPTGRFRQDVLVWNVPNLEPGDTWTVKVRVEVMSYAKKTIANTATVVYGGQTWLKSRLRYAINDQEVVAVIQQGLS